MTSTIPDEPDFIADTRVWLERAVIGLNLCPFAKAVLAKEQVRFVLSRATHIDALLEDLDDELELLARAAANQVDTTLLIHPFILQDFLDFNEFLQLADRAVGERGFEGVLQVASFHPSYQFDGTAPDELGNFSNRSPYPTLHLLREQSIDRAVAVFPDAASIYATNIKTLEQLGLDGWEALWRR